MPFKFTALIMICTTQLAQIANAQECDPQAIQNEIQSNYASRIAGAEGVCAAARLQIEMLEYAKESYSACLRGKALQDTILELDRVIRQAHQAQADVGGC